MWTRNEEPKRIAPTVRLNDFNPYGHSVLREGSMTEAVEMLQQEEQARPAAPPWIEPTTVEDEIETARQCRDYLNRLQEKGKIKISTLLGAFGQNIHLSRGVPRTVIDWEELE